MNKFLTTALAIAGAALAVGGVLALPVTTVGQPVPDGMTVSTLADGSTLYRDGGGEAASGVLGSLDTAEADPNCNLIYNASGSIGYVTIDRYDGTWFNLPKNASYEGCGSRQSWSLRLYNGANIWFDTIGAGYAANPDKIAYGNTDPGSSVNGVRYYDVPTGYRTNVWLQAA